MALSDRSEGLWLVELQKAFLQVRRVLKTFHGLLWQSSPLML